MAGERNADDIQRDIEKSRAALAAAVDELAYRGNPKRILDQTKASLKAKAQTPAGRVVIAAAGGLIAVVIIRRIAKH